MSEWSEEPTCSCTRPFLDVSCLMSWCCWLLVAHTAGTGPQATPSAGPARKYLRDRIKKETRKLNELVGSWVVLCQATCNNLLVDPLHSRRIQPTDTIDYDNRSMTGHSTPLQNLVMHQWLRPRVPLPVFPPCPAQGTPPPSCPFQTRNANPGAVIRLHSRAWCTRR